jgi:hypothetical protein
MTGVHYCAWLFIVGIGSCLVFCSVWWLFFPASSSWDYRCELPCPALACFLRYCLHNFFPCWPGTVILLSLLPSYLGLHVWDTMPSLFGEFLYYCFDIIPSSDLFGLFLSSWVNFGRSYVNRNYSFLLDFAACWYIIFSIFPNNPLDFTGLYCKVVTF